MPIPHNAYSTDWSTFLENINSIWICNFFPEEYVNICMMIMFISCFVVYINSAQNYFFYANWKFMFMYVNICSNVKFHNIFRWDTPLFNAIIFITSLSNHFLSHKFFTFCVIFIDILKTLSKLSIQEYVLKANSFAQASGLNCWDWVLSETVLIYSVVVGGMRPNTETRPFQ